MIPKIIHLCWLSEEPFPADIQRCLDSWHEMLPDYEIMLWDTNRFDINSVVWTKEAFEIKKYAFAADYIRLFALYNYGGIYLDSDVLVYKSFDDLLDLPYFIGQDYMGFFEAAIIGAEKGQKWVKEVLDYYKGRHFVKNDGTLDVLPLPQIFLLSLYGKYNFIGLHKKISYVNSDTFYLFDSNFFNSRDSLGVKRKKCSYCAHNYAGSWKSRTNYNWKVFIKNRVPKCLMKIYFAISHNTFKKAWIHRADPLYLQSKGIKSINNYNLA